MDKPRTEAGNAERLVDACGDAIRYCKALDTWFRWTGTRWEKDNTGWIHHTALRIVRKMYGEAEFIQGDKDRKDFLKWVSQSEHYRSLVNMVNIAGFLPSIAVKAEQLDADRMLLNVDNGTLDLRTGELLEHRREDLITKLAPVTYDADATLELWDRFLEEATGGSALLRAFLQRAVGYSLTGDTSEEKLFFLHGPTGTGKTTFLEAMKATVGDYAVTADFETFLRRRATGGHREDLIRLVGARFVASVEVDKGKKLAEGLIKQLTGGDTVRARDLYVKSVEFQPRFKAWLSANDAPGVDAEDGAMWRRIVRVPFVHAFANPDPDVKKMLRNPGVAGTAILAWAMRGCLLWQREGLGSCPEVDAATARYREEMDVIGDFFGDHVIFDPEKRVRALALQKAYGDWIKTMHLADPPAWKHVTQRLRDRGCVRKPDKSGQIWRGVGLTA